jgi:hypothetical protein
MCGPHELRPIKDKFVESVHTKNGDPTGGDTPHDNYLGRGH